MEHDISKVVVTTRVRGVLQNEVFEKMPKGRYKGRKLILSMKSTKFKTNFLKAVVKVKIFEFEVMKIDCGG